MVLRKVALGAGAIVAGYIALQVIMWLISAVVSTVITVATLAITIGVIAAFIWGGLKLYGWYANRGTSKSTDTLTQDDEIAEMDSEDVLRQQYLNGEITEDEFERRMGGLMDNQETESDVVVDRELESLTK